MKKKPHLMSSDPIKKSNTSVLFLKEAFKEAKIGINSRHGGPFGAVVVYCGRIIGRGHNTVLKDLDPTCHAEINAIRDACKNRGQFHLTDCILYTSSEPCPMCLTTAYWAQLKEIHYAVGKDTADLLGFSDEFIYEQLKKTHDTAQIPLIHHPELQTEGKKVFSYWLKNDAKLY